MCGISGSGKTHFSRLLESNGFERISVDENVWRKYGSDFAKFPFPQQKEIFMAADIEVMQQLSSLIKDRKKVVVDSTMCKRFKRDKVRAFCHNLGIDPLVVYLHAPKHLLFERLSRREGTGPNDQKVTSEQLDSFYSNFEIPEKDERVLEINQSEFPV